MALLDRTADYAKRAGIRGTLRYIPHWASEKYHERRLGIETAGYRSVADLGLSGATAESGAYEPASYRSIFRALKAVGVRPGEDVFLDFGSGKGRAVIAAATFPFKRVIGVELSEELNGIAARNLERTRAKLRCPQVELVQADLLRYEPPDDVSVVFSYGPFFGEDLRPVIARLKASLLRKPRRMTLIIKYPDWAADPLESDPGFALEREDRSYSAAGERLRIYRTTATGL